MGEAIFAVLGVSVAAFAIWLTVRIINLRERWAIRAAIATALLAFAGFAVVITFFTFASDQEDRDAFYEESARVFETQPQESPQ